MKSKSHIKPDAELKDLLKLPRVKEVFIRYRLGCLKCSGIGSEKLKHAAQCHGIDLEELMQSILDGSSPRE